MGVSSACGEADEIKSTCHTHVVLLRFTGPATRPADGRTNIAAHAARHSNPNTHVPVLRYLYRPLGLPQDHVPLLSTLFHSHTAGSGPRVNKNLTAVHARAGSAPLRWRCHHRAAPTAAGSPAYLPSTCREVPHVCECGVAGSRRCVVNRRVCRGWNAGRISFCSTACRQISIVVWHRAWVDQRATVPFRRAAWRGSGVVCVCVCGGGGGFQQVRNGTLPRTSQRQCHA